MAHRLDSRGRPGEQPGLARPSSTRATPVTPDPAARGCCPGAGMAESVSSPAQLSVKGHPARLLEEQLAQREPRSAGRAAGQRSCAAGPEGGKPAAHVLVSLWSVGLAGPLACQAGIRTVPAGGWCSAGPEERTPTISRYSTIQISAIAGTIERNA